MSECRHGIPMYDICDACSDELHDYVSVPPRKGITVRMHDADKCAVQMTALKADHAALVARVRMWAQGFRRETRLVGDKYYEKWLDDLLAVLGPEEKT